MLVSTVLSSLLDGNDLMYTWVPTLLDRRPDECDLPHHDPDSHGYETSIYPGQYLWRSARHLQDEPADCWLG